MYGIGRSAPALVRGVVLGLLVATVSGCGLLAGTMTTPRGVATPSPSAASTSEQPAASAEPAGSASPAASVTPGSSVPLAEFRFPVDPAVLPFDYWCGASRTFPATALVGPTASADDLGSLDAMARAELDDAPPGTAWRVAIRGEDDGERLLVGVTGPSSVIYVRLRWDDMTQRFMGRGSSAWRWAGSGDCEPEARFERPVAGAGFLQLDPDARPPGSRARRVRLLVSDMRGCRDAVRVMGEPQIVMTDDAVVVAVPTRRRINTANCGRKRPTRLTVHLPEPLGDRVLYDASTLPLRRIRLP